MTPMIVSFEHDDPLDSGTARAKNWFSGPRARVILLAILLSLFAHVLGVTILPRVLAYLDALSRLAPKPIEVKTIDPAQIDSIKDAWKKKEQLLIDPHSRASEANAPENARYASDRNQTVQKETQAKRTAAVPKARPRQAKPEKKLRLPNLRDLGVRLPSPMGGMPMAPRKQAQAERSDDVSDPQTDWGDQELLDEKLQYGEENMLNTRESIYYSFYSRIYQQISPIWTSKVREATLVRAIPEGRYEALVDVVLDREGNLSEIIWIQSSGYKELDQAVENSWARVKKFANPPRALIEADGKVHLPWKFVVDSSQRGRFLPPVRISR